MSKIIIAILLLALGWHLSIIGISRFILSRRKNPTLKKIAPAHRARLAPNPAQKNEEPSQQQAEELPQSHEVKGNRKLAQED